MNRISTLLASLCILVASAVHAQGLPASVGGIELSASTDNPVPGQTVTITAQSYTVDIHASTLTWTAGGKVITKGVGQNVITVQAPATGKRLTVSLSAATPDGNVLTGSLSIGSGVIDMIVEPRGYTPPFFKGKIPNAYQNTFKVTAIPHLSNSAGVEYDPSTLVYKWEQGGSVIQDQSGYGKQSVVLTGNIVPRPYEIMVTATTRDGSASASALGNVGMDAPSVVFYKNDPLYGPLLNSAIGSTLFLSSQKEVGVLAVPYGFNDAASAQNNLSFTWLINGSAHPELAANRSITLRAPSDQSGSSNIQLTVGNSKAILEQAQSGFSTVWNISANNAQSSAVTF
ncbi:MAG: hypothetical protein JWO00_158 [Candidatus Parcubacteria bacterium]|nr:hypothetical protein [Candidatus Parcubacteria bacterium]